MKRTFFLVILLSFLVAGCQQNTQKEADDSLVEEDGQSVSKKEEQVQETVEQQEPMVVETVYNHPSSYDKKDGLITISVVGGQGPYHYLVNDEPIENGEFICGEGEFDIIVTDELNNKYQETIILSAPLVVSLIERHYVENWECLDQVRLFIHGGYPPYKILINGEETTTDFIVQSGKYEVSVKDSMEQEEVFEVSVKSLETSSIVDTEGNEYVTVKIGEQWWMAENIRMTQDVNGQGIDYRIYNDDESNASLGYLYDYENAMKIHIDGWHIPTHEDFMLLEQELGMSQADAEKIGSSERGKDLGKSLKGQGISGFSATMNGWYAGEEHGYGGLGEGVAFVTSSMSGDMVIVRTLMKNDHRVYCYPDPTDWSFYVRLVKDSE